MIVGDLRNKVDSIWNTIWTGGITNPITAVEQITYLMFIKLLDDIEKIQTLPQQIKNASNEAVCQQWRREGDSNSRSRFPQTNDLANRPLQPLGYPSSKVILA